MTPRLVGALAAATLSLAVTTGLGAQLGLVDTSGVRWVHHVLYAAALTTGVGAALTSLGTPAARSRAGAVGALVVLPRTRGGTPLHAALATGAGVLTATGAVRQARAR